MSTVIVRNGSKLCAKCRDKGCECLLTAWPFIEDLESQYVTDEPCSCCESDFTVPDDDLGT